MVDLHRTKLSTKQIIFEAAFFSLLVVYFVFRKTISSFWKKFLRNISEKSKLAGAILPHTVYFGICLMLYLSLNEIFIPLTSARLMPLCTVVIPLMTTLRILSFYGSTIPPTHYLIGQIENSYNIERIDAFRHQILVWIVLGIYHALATSLALLPFSSRVLTNLPIVKYFFIISLVWVQISPNFAGFLFKFTISHVLRGVAAIFPTSGVGALEASAASKSRTMFGVMKMFGLINSRHEEFLISLFQDGMATLIALAFIFTPYPIASLGMVGISLLLPAFRSSGTSSLVRSRSGTRLQPPLISTEDSIAEYQKWLHYWVCIASLWILRIYTGLQLWPSIMTISSLWLQHSYFQGATFSFQFIGELSTALASRNADTQAAVAAAPQILDDYNGGIRAIADSDSPAVEEVTTNSTSSIPIAEASDRSEEESKAASPSVDVLLERKTPKKSAKKQPNEIADHKEIPYNTRRAAQNKSSDSKMTAGLAAAASKNVDASDEVKAGPFSDEKRQDADT